MHGSTLEWLLKIYPSSSHQNVQIPPSPQFITFWLWHIHFSFAFVLLRLHKQLYMLLYGWLGFFEAKNSSGLRWTLLSLADAQEGHRPLLKVSYFSCGKCFSRTEKDTCSSLLFWNNCIYSQHFRGLWIGHLPT